MHLTGSPRADLWKSVFSEYWDKPRSVPEKPYLLVSSNMATANGIRPIYERIQLDRSGGHYLRDPDLFARRFGVISEEYQTIFAFIKAIRHLAMSCNDFDIVLRPHPAEK